MSNKQDSSLETLLLLDGESFVADTDGKLWVKFIVKSVAASAQRPHGIKSYTSAATLLNDFWQEVELILQERSF